MNIGEYWEGGGKNRKGEERKIDQKRRREKRR